MDLIVTDRAAEGGSRQMMGKMINSLNFKKLNGKDKVMKAFFDVAVATTTTQGQVCNKDCILKWAIPGLFFVYFRPFLIAIQI